MIYAYISPRQRPSPLERGAKEVTFISSGMLLLEKIHSFHGWRVACDRSGKQKLPHARFQNLDLAAEQHFRGDPILAHHTIRSRGGRSLRVGCIIYDVSYTGWSEIHKFRFQSSVELVGRQGDRSTPGPAGRQL